MEEKIDFVVLWVDGNDPELIKEKNKYIRLIVSRLIMMVIICIVIVITEHSIIGLGW